MAHHRADHLGLVVKPRMEQGADGPVDQARGQGFLLAGPAFAFKKSAGNLAGGKGLFLVVDRQREKVDPHARFLLGDGGAKHGGLAVGSENGAVGLAGDLPGLEDQLAPCPFDFFPMYIKHVFLPSNAGPVPMTGQPSCNSYGSGPMRREVIHHGIPPIGAGRRV